MEGKKTITISLTNLLLIIAIVIIAIMGVYIYKEKNNTNNEVSQYETEIKNLNEKIESLKESNKENNSENNNKESLLKEESDTITYNSDEYSFKYDKNWKNLGIATKETVGSVNRRVGSLQLEIEKDREDVSTRISIIKHSNITLNKYIEEHKKMYLNSKEEGGYNLKNDSSYTGNSLSMYKISFTQNDYIYVSYLIEKNNTVYEIEYAGEESTYTSLQNKIEEMVNSFELNK